MQTLALSDLSFTYAGASAPALRKLTCSFPRGSFTLLCGATGSGKSTLLRLLKRELTPRGALSGSILLDGKPLSALSEREAAARIGYVGQRPEEQIVTDRVWHELAFGPESLGLPTAEIRRRVAEIAAYFDMESWFERETDSLSGGEKQLLALASVLVTEPEVLLLDEPTAELDPVAAENLLSAVARLHRDLSLTVILVEHRLESVLPLCDRVLALEEGTLLTSGAPREALSLLARRPEFLPGAPAAVRVFSALAPEELLPLSPAEGRARLERDYRNAVRSPERPAPAPAGREALSLSGLFFRYGRGGRDILRNLSLTLHEGEFYCLLGGNGSGKSTLLAAAAGLRRPYAGKVRASGAVALLPQDVQTLFCRESVREELAEVGADPAELPFDLSPFLERHPYDLSGGERQRAALAKVLAGRPRILLLDEPTRGLDGASRARLAEILRSLTAQGLALLCVTHDVELAARAADRCGLLFRGEVISEDAPAEFFSRMSVYTTAASRMSRGFFDGAVTAEDVIALCRRNGRREA